MEYEISPKKLRELQLVQLDILIEFDKICRINNLPYQLFAGTLLGAIRHKGFIPWDDDVDVCMLREDYNRFLELCKAQLDKKYFLQTYETDSNYIHSFARIRKNNTIALQRSYIDIDMHHGIFIDVFPMDNALPDTILGKVQQKVIYPFRNLKRLKIKSRCLNSRKPYYTPIKLFFYYLLKPISIKSLNRIESKIATMFDWKETKYITHLTDASIKEYYRYISSKQDFEMTIEVEFEKHLFLAPKEYHKVLTQCFGDYLKLPPKNERKPHHGIIKVETNISTASK